MTKTVAIALLGLSVCVAPSVAWAQDKSTVTVAGLDQAPVDDAALGAIAGREDTRSVAIANQTAGVSRNSVGDNVTTGEARIDGNAFQNMSGLSILNVNTGNNVAVNAAMNVNIAINPAP